MSNKTITQSLRQAVHDSGESLTQIARQTQIDLGNLSRFARGERHLSAESLDRLSEHLGLMLVRPGQRGRGRRGAARFGLAAAVALSQAEPGPITDAFAALVSIGHSQSQARALLGRATSGGRQFSSAADVLAAIYQPS